MNYTIRGKCQCGRCLPHTDELPENIKHTVNNGFFDVALNPEIDNPNADMVKQLCTNHKPSFGPNIDLFDGEEHSYIEIGGWLGDQGLALMLMGLGAILGMWELLTPDTILGDTISQALKQQMAGMGMVTIKANSI